MFSAIGLITLLVLSRTSVEVDMKDPDITTVNVAEAIAKAYLTRCNILLIPDNATWVEERRIYKVSKRLSITGTTVVKTFKQYEEYNSDYRYNNRRCARMLNLVYGYDDTVKMQMNQVR